MPEAIVDVLPKAWYVEATAEWNAATQRVVVRLTFNVTDWKGPYHGPSAPLPVQGKSDTTVVLQLGRTFGAACGEDDYADVILDLALGLRIAGTPVVTTLACDAIKRFQAEQNR